MKIKEKEKKEKKKTLDKEMSNLNCLLLSTNNLTTVIPLRFYLFKSLMN